MTAISCHCRFRPERAAIFGETGLLAALEERLRRRDTCPAGRSARGHQSWRNEAQAAAASARRQGGTAAPDGGEGSGRPRWCSDRPGRRIVSRRSAARSEAFPRAAARSVEDDAPAVIAVFTIRSEQYGPLQLAAELDGLRQDTYSLPPMPKGAYAEVIKGPARRLEGPLDRSPSRRLSSMRCLPILKRAAKGMRCRCSPLPWSGSTASTTLAAV